MGLIAYTVINILHWLLGADSEILHTARLVVKDGLAVTIVLIGEACERVIHLGIEYIAAILAILLEALLELGGCDVLALLRVALEK